MGWIDDLKKEISAEIQAKVGELIKTTYGGDYRKAFDHYDKLTTQNSKVDKKAIIQMLEDAGVKERFAASHGKMASGIIEEYDENEDSQISWEEFSKVFEADTR